MFAAVLPTLVSQGCGAGSSNTALIQLPGRAGCLTSEPRAGCGRLVGAAGSGSIVISADGRSVYVASDGSLAVLRRNVQTGVLSQPSGRAACIQNPAPYWYEKRCLPLADFFPLAVAVSPDGRWVYVASGAVDVGGGRDRAWTRFDIFRRDTQSGNLSRLLGAGMCFYDAAHSQPRPPRGCTPASGLSVPDAVAVSPDGRFVYVGSTTLYAQTRGITVFRRLESGGLRQQPSVRRSAFPTGSETPVSVERLVLSPDGKNLYAVVTQYDLIVAFDRDARTGTLTRLKGPAGCLSASPRPGCLAVKGSPRFWDGAVLTVSADGRNLYLANQNRVMTISRRADGALETRHPAVQLPSTVRTIDIAPDGRTAYILTNRGILASARSAQTGVLSAPRCDRSTSTQCGLPNAPGVASAAVITPDGRHVYALGTSGEDDRFSYVTTYTRRAP
jgi:DNA-binding beta-propeller fold protein YncE